MKAIPLLCAAAALSGALLAAPAPPVPSGARPPPAEAVEFYDDFLWDTASPDWEPISGAWEVSSTFHPRFSPNSYSLFARLTPEAAAAAPAPAPPAVPAPAPPPGKEDGRKRTREPKEAKESKEKEPKEKGPKAKEPGEKEPKVNRLDQDRAYDAGYVGVGLECAPEGKAFEVMFVFEKSSASEAGLREDDRIVKVNGEEIRDDNALDLLDLLSPWPTKGPIGEASGPKKRPKNVAVEYLRGTSTARQTADLKFGHLENADGGRKLLLKPYQAQPRALLVVGRPSWKNYAVQAAVRGSGKEAMGIVSCFASEKDHLLLRWTPQGALELVAVEGGREKTAATKPLKYAPDQWYRLGLSAEGPVHRAFLDGQEVLSWTDPSGRARAGKAGLFAAGAGAEGAYFDDVQAVSTGVSDLAFTREGVVLTSYAGDKYMENWAFKGSEWKLDAAANVLWNIYAYPGDARVLVPEPASGAETRVRVAPDGALSGGATLAVNWKARRVSFSAPGSPPVSAAFLPIERGFAFEMDQGVVKTAAPDGSPALLGPKTPIPGAVRIGVVKGAGEEEVALRIASSKMRDYTFTTAAVDWESGGGNWGMKNRWTCTPRWSWLGGSGTGSVVLWHKGIFEGNVTFEFFAAELMMGVKDVRKGEGRPFVHITVLGDGKSPDSGYSVVTNRKGEDLFSLRRNGREVAAHAGSYFPGAHSKEWQHFRLEKKGGQVSFHLNGKPLLSWNDPAPIPRGRVAVWTVDEAFCLARARVTFDKMAGIKSP